MLLFLYYCILSMLDGLLLNNVMGCNAVLSGSLSYGNCILSLTCRSPAPWFTPDTSVSKYIATSHYKISCMHHSC